MISSTLSVLGLTEYRPDLWDEFVIPEGINKQDLIDDICVETMDLEVLYTNPDFLKKAIGVWSRKELPIWEKLQNTTTLEYNPLWNVEEWREEVRQTVDNGEHADTTSSQRDLTDKIDSSHEDSSTRDLDSTDTINSSRNSSGTNHGKSTSSQTNGSTNSSNSFNAGAMIPNNSSSATLTANQESDGTTSGTESAQSTEVLDSTETNQSSGTTNQDRVGKDVYAEDKNGTNKNVRDDRYVVNRHGNIGVTSSQELLKQEREVSQFCIEDYIVDSFKHKFIILVY